MVEVEEEEKNAQGRTIGTIYKLVKEDGPRRVASVAGVSDAHELGVVKHALVLFGMSEATVSDMMRIVSETSY